MIRVYGCDSGDIYMLCEDCALRGQRDLWPTGRFAPPGIDCDLCSSSQEAPAPSPTIPPTAKDPQ